MTAAALAQDPFSNRAAVENPQMISSAGPMQQRSEGNAESLMQTFSRLANEAVEKSTGSDQSLHRVSMTEYNEQTSHQLFAACDGNGDDRLDLFEARSALEELGDPSSLDWFRRLDLDRNGYLEWPELDKFYRTIVENGNTFRLRLVRAQPDLVTAPTEDPAEDQKEDVAASGISLFDKDGDGALNPDEIKNVLEAFQLPPAAIGLLKNLDVNQNGMFETSELAPVLGNFEMGLFQSVVQPEQSQLAEPWASIDANGSNRIDLAEFRRSVRVIDPQLDHWTLKLFASLDLDGNERITTEEFPRSSLVDTMPANKLLEAPAPVGSNR
ncbi:MAG: hypothetical protein VYE77_06955 [Planctomycetota bacterium]|nr:hypothetical protein [Planctomycetota bacterium]